MGFMRIIVLMFVCIVTTRTEARVIALNDASDVTDGTGGLWQPPNGRTREDFFKYHGQTPEEMARVKQKMMDNANQATVPNDAQLDNCIWLEETQVDALLSEQKEANAIDMKGVDFENHHRQKRQIQDFEKYPRRQWTTMPIRYKFDGEHSESEKNIIRGAFDHWMAHTCVQFEELSTNADYDDNHILITRRSTGCHSYVGKVSIILQQLNLQSSCLSEFGIPVHEIGHSLGLWHVEQRRDRDDYIRINWESLGSYVGQFYQNTASVDLGVPYDFGSVMHYSPKGKNRPVIKSVDPQYQGNIGQMTGLSFLDAKITNLAYCSDKCGNESLTRPCERNGYQDPKNCSICICPDGFSGKYCEDLEPASNAECGGELMATTSPQTIKTPGYDSPRYYDNFQQCNWHIKAPANHDIIFKFKDDNFGIYCHDSGSCYHWAEVRYKNSLGQQGPRFCCYRAPDDVIRGELGEMMIIFKTNYSVPSTASRRGFKASFYAEPRDVQPPATTTTGAPTTTTKKSTTTTTTPTTTTTTPPTTTSRNDEPRNTQSPEKPTTIVWTCSFENINGPSLCGMTQDENDDFDWTIRTGRTPSRNTGPTSALDGGYYAFIEASKPRKRNDFAVVILPDLDLTGTHCLNFNYHMYGFHVNTLHVLMKTSEGTETQLWHRSKEQGDMWIEARVEVELGAGSKLAFKAVRGGEYSGDIALDNIRLHSGNCSISAGDVISAGDDMDETD